MSINYATQYQRALANAYPQVLHFGALWSNDNTAKYKPVNAQTIMLPVLDVTGRVDGSRGTITGPSVRHSNNWETKTLTNHRKWDTLVHPVDIDQTNMVLTIRNITKTYNEQEKFPEMDCYTSSKIYTDWAAAGGAANTTAQTSETILAYIDSVMDAMDEAFVPQTGRILYCTPAIRTTIKNAKEIQRYWGSESAIARTVNRVDELTIEAVPSKILKTAYNFTVGAVPAAGAKQIHMMFLHASSILPIQTYSTAMLSEPSAVTEGKYVYFEEAFEDVFILNRRKNAIAFNIEA